MQISGKKERTKEQTHTNVPSEFLTKLQEQFNGVMIDFSTNGPGMDTQINLNLNLTTYVKINSKMDHRLKYTR